MNAILVMVKADGSRRDFPLDKDRLVVGRVNECDLRIPVAAVSRKHCEFVVEDETLTLHDLGSSNGTFHNHNRIQEVILKAGDHVSIGPVEFIVVIDGLPEEMPQVKSRGKAPPAPPSVAVSRKPAGAAKPTDEEDEEIVLMEPDPVSSPRSATVDLDDPIAALEALAEASELDIHTKKGPKGGTPGKRKS